MEFVIEGKKFDLDVASLTVAGWTGRQQDKVLHHVEELKLLGVAPPSKTPLFYRAAKESLTQADEIDVLGSETSGEAEPILTSHEGRLLIGLASDHTDRDLETHSIPHSKQICAKPVSLELWPLEKVAELDALSVQTEILEDRDWIVYQKGTVDGILPLRSLWQESGLSDGDWMLCGTFPAIGGIRAASAYRMVMTDPGTGQAIKLEYTTRELPIVS